MLLYKHYFKIHEKWVYPAILFSCISHELKSDIIIKEVTFLMPGAKFWKNYARYHITKWREFEHNNGTLRVQSAHFRLKRKPAFRPVILLLQQAPNTPPLFVGKWNANITLYAVATEILLWWWCEMFSHNNAQFFHRVIDWDHHTLTLKARNHWACACLPIFHLKLYSCSST